MFFSAYKIYGTKQKNNGTQFTICKFGEFFFLSENAVLTTKGNENRCEAYVVLNLSIYVRTEQIKSIFNKITCMKND